MADLDGAPVVFIVHIVIDTGDGDCLWGLPVGRSKGQRAGHRRGIGVTALWRHGDIAGGPNVEPDMVGGGASGFGHVHTGF